MPAPELSHSEQVYAIKTWRYLRLAMIALVIGLGVSIGFERSKVHPGCFQQSISAYYYTPVQAMLVGSLVAIGVCMLSLHGNTDTEDVLLNLAGMFAQVVALVPTPGTGSCASVLGTTKDRDVNIANNVFALLAVGLVAILVGGFLVIRALVTNRRPSVTALVGYGVAVAVWIAASVVFGTARHFFIRNAHYAAAILMFVCILLVVLLNAFAFKAKTGADSVRNRYLAIASAMLAAVVVIAILALTTDWRHWVLVLEGSLIGLFALFWATQTKELWHDGLR